MQLSTVRQHYQQGFSSVLRLIEQLEMEIENLTLAQSSKHHDNYLRQTINIQKSEIERLHGKIENKSQQLLDSQRSNHQLRKAGEFHQKEKVDLHRRWQHKFGKLENRLSDARQLNQQLEAKIRELEKCLESDTAPAIKLDSHNSSLPPSSDLPWSKPKQTKSLRQKSGLQAGGQPGHRGSTLLQVHQPDLIIVHPVGVCRHCHYSLISNEPLRFNKRQIFEIDNGRLTVIEHQTEVKLCTSCRKISKGHFPDNLNAPVQYGSSVFSRIVYLNQYQLLPVARTAETMNDLFECPLSWATIKRATKFCADKLVRFEYRLKAKLRNSEVMGVDETSININGENNWVHVARTDHLTYLAFHPKRGQAAIEEIGIINEFTGTLVRDGFVSYQKYEQCRHGLCNAHLLRDLTFIGEADPVDRGWTSELAALLLEIKASVKLAQSNALGSLDAALQNTFSTRYDRILAEAELVIRGSPELISTHLSAGTLRRRFIRHKELILRFMTDFRVPFDNNGSERDLRMLKLQQKISGCFRTTNGAKVFCRIRSYLSSARKQGRGLLIALEQAVNGKPIILTM